jgi:hypothetical protein
MNKILKEALAYVEELNEQAVTEMGMTIMSVRTDGQNVVVVFGEASIWDSTDYAMEEVEAEDVKSTVRSIIDRALQVYFEEVDLFRRSVFGLEVE